MANRKNIKTTKKEIVDYWSRIIDESDLATDWTEAEEIGTIFRSLFNGTISHYGQHDLNDATLVAIRRLALIEIVKKNNLGVEFKI